MKDPLCNLPGAMTIVEKVYLKWMFDDLKLSKITGFLFFLIDHENESCFKTYFQ